VLTVRMSTAPATSSVERFTITSLTVRIGRWTNELNRTEAPQTHVGCLHGGYLAQRDEFPIPADRAEVVSLTRGGVFLEQPADLMFC
jgi:hypothetical protein